jgi:outer membrane protein assembly factor BamB
LAERFPYAFITAGNTHFCGGEDEVAAYAVENARQLWSAPVDGRAYGLAVAGGCLLVSTDQGCVYCFTPTWESDAGIVAATPAVKEEHFEPVTDRQATAVANLLQIAEVHLGYCLVVGSRSGWLAEEIARQSQLKVVGLDADPAWVARARERIDRQGYYGRVSILEGQLDQIAWAPHLFNLIVSESMFETGKQPVGIQRVKRLLRPGGRAIMARRRQPVDEWKVVEGEPVDGAGSWTHMYADPANTACSGERRLNGPLQLQWFGQPGPRDMVDRHHRTVPPLFSAGRLFIPGNNRVIAVDAYNGTILWNVEIPDSRRVGALRDSGNMVAAEDLFYVVTKDRCLGLDADSGQQTMTFHAPTCPDGNPRDWGYLARVDDQLIGTTTRPGASRSGHSRRTIDETYYDFIPMVTSDSMFAVARHSGEKRWHYRAQTGAIANPSIAIAGGNVVFVESKNERTLKHPDGRVTLPELLANRGAALVTLDVATGNEIWRREIDLRSIQHQLFLACADQKIVIVGSRNQTDQAGKESVWFDVHCYNAHDGKLLWNATQDQKRASGGSHGEQDQHPVIVSGLIYVEPYAYNLSDGMRRPGWKLVRGGHGCGTMSASASACFFRADNPTMCDLATGKLTKVTKVSRPGCWINMIPAGGLLLIPEASSGCVCDFPIQTSMAFAPAGE